MRRFGTTALLSFLPAAAFADGTMPQMDFHNPLTTDQVLWMGVILVVLYLLLARWGLPGMGKVLANRAQVIQHDLAAARAAKTSADQAVALMHATMAQARQKAQAEVAEMVAKAQARAAANVAALEARLEKNLAESEARIDEARSKALAAIKPVAEAATQTILLKLTGMSPEAATVSARVDAAMAARKVA